MEHGNIRAQSFGLPIHTVPFLGSEPCCLEVKEEGNLLQCTLPRLRNKDLDQ